MSPTKNKLPDLAEIQQRFATACDMKQTIDRAKIVECFTRWLASISEEKLPVKFIETFEQAKNYSRDARDAVWDNSWLPITAVGALSRADEKVFQTWLQLLEAFEAGAWLFYITKTEIAGAVIPEKTAVDDQRRLHNETGAAFSWADVREYYWHGVRVSEDVIMHPEKITLKAIEDESNSEIRRVLITRYGMQRWLLDSKAEAIHQDDTGVLYRQAVKGSDEPIVMVRVVNSTKEKGIGYREFFVPVDPQLRPLPPGRWSSEKKAQWLEQQKPQALTAHNAVASTWGMRGEDYSPACQT